MGKNPENFVLTGTVWNLTGLDCRVYDYYVISLLRIAHYKRSVSNWVMQHEKKTVQKL